MKRPQNIIAEGGLTLPVAALFGIVVWLLSGLVQQRLWLQLACFVATVYVLIELTNQNALLRVRSRMVSSTFIVLSCAASFLLPQMTGGIVQFCFVMAFLLLFQTYQTSHSIGRTFYAFTAIGLASIAFVHVLWYVPVLWILMATQLQSLNWRTWLTSLLGLAMPYWFALLWFLLPFNLSDEWTTDFTPLADHFSKLADIAIQSPITSHLFLGGLLVFILTIILATIGMAHFWQYSFEDKMRLLTLCTSPLIAHVLTFTSSRLSNILFFVALALALALAVFNLWGNV